jgi:transcriptional regulator with XRE-family HTH domain
MHYYTRTPNRLRKYRSEAGYSQRQAARLLGFNSAAQLSRWENGSTIPTVENLLKLSILYHHLPTQLYLDFYWDLKDRLHGRLEMLSSTKKNLAAA